jgi:sugar phosphate isomerase/epimerase
MRFSVSTYSFGGYVDRLGIEKVIEKAAEMGFEGIEFVEGGWTQGLSKDVARSCRKIAADNGLETVSYCVGADFLYGSGGDLEKEVDRIKAQVDFAVELGVANMRHDVAYGMRGTDGKLAGIGYDNALPRLAEGCRKVTEYAESVGVGTMTENHGYFSQDANRVEKLINTVDHRNFGALVDIGNFMCADEEPVKSVSIMAPYAKHVHCKDFHYKAGTQESPGYGWFPTRAQNWLRGAILGHGVVPVGQCIRILKANGYDGFLSIEFEGIEDNLLGIRLGLECLNRVAR